MKIAGMLIVVASLVTAWIVIPLFQDKLGPHLNAGRWVVLWLGAEVGLTVMLAIYGAVIVGCHRWDLHNGISALVYGITTAGMILVLLAGRIASCGLCTLRSGHGGRSSSMVARAASLS